MEKRDIVEYAALFLFLADAAYIAFLLMQILFGPFSFNLTSAEWAAWIQGSGSILAVIVAIYVPWQLRKNEIHQRELEKNAERQVAAAFLCNALGEVESLIESTISLLPQFVEITNFERAIKASALLEIQISPEITNSLPKLNLFPEEVARNVAHALSWVAIYNRGTLRIIQNAQINGTFGDRKNELLEIRKTLEVAKGVIQHVLPSLRMMGGSNKPLPANVQALAAQIHANNIAEANVAKR